MKNVLQSGLIILLIVAGIYIIFLRECKKTTVAIASDEMVIKKSVWDSIQALANKPPIVKVDTVYLPGKVVHASVTPMPKPEVNSKDSTINTYRDSIYNKQIKVWVDFSVKGKLLDRRWTYIPIISQVNKTVTEYVPKIINNPVETPKRKLFLSGIMGGNANAFAFGGGLDFITKKNTLIGYQYQRLGSENFHSVRLGIKLF